ncbi:MAG: beta strand repeat-containing protein, partial [Pseudomonadota bacterium]
MTNTTSGGHTSLDAGQDVLQNANVVAQESGKTVDVLAGRHITMAQGTQTSTNNGNLLLRAAAGDITIETLAAGTANVSVTASAGNVIDGDTADDTEVDITAAGLLLTAGSSSGIGSGSNHLETTVSNLTAVAGSGGVFVTETDAVTVTSLTVNAQRVDAEGSSSLTTNSTQGGLSSAATTNGHIVLVSLGGDMTLNSAVAADGSGNVLLQTLTGGAGSSITANADVSSGSGNVSVLATASVSFTLSADIRTTSTGAGSGSIDVEAAVGAITQHSTSVFLSTGAAAQARLKAATNVTVGDVELADGQVSITATSGSILDTDALVGVANDTDQDVTASALRLVAGTGVGQTVNHLETTVATLSARATSGGIFVLESNGLTVGDVAVTVNRVLSTGLVTGSTQSDALQSDLRTTSGNGSIVLRSTTGDIVLSDGTATADNTAVSADGSGHILIQTLSTTGDITANADIGTGTTSSVSTGTGSISIVSGNDVTFTTGADIRSQGTNSAGTIDVVAANGGNIVMAANSVFGSTNGAIRLLAAADIQVGVITTAVSATPGDGSGMVSLTATSGSIVDAQSLGNTTQDNTVNVVASGLRLNAGTGVGQTVNHLETTVATLSARATSGGLFVLESNGLTVDDVAVTVNRVLSTGAVTGSTVVDAAQGDLRTTGGNGSIVLRSTTGHIVLNDGTATDDDTAVSAHGSGLVLVQTLDAAGDITANADIVSSTGSISVLSGNDVTFATGADIRSQGTDSAGTIDVVAANAGNIVMAANSVFGSTNGAIRLLAAADIQVGVITTAASATPGDGSGMVSLTATSGSIVDAQNLGNTSQDSIVNVVASGLRLNAGLGVGQTVNHLETTVATLSARATSGGIFVLESNGLTVGDVAVTVNRVLSTGLVTGSTQSDALQSDLRTTSGNGSIVLRSTTGDIVLNDGTATADNTAVSADGSGNILIQTLSTTGDITANADIGTSTASSTSTGTGSISVVSGNDVTFTTGADIRTQGTGSAGTIDVVAANGGSIVMAANSVFGSTNGAIRLLAAADIQVGVITTAASATPDDGSGMVSLRATSGSIVDAQSLGNESQDSIVNVVASGLRLNAGLGVGQTVNHLETTVATLSARATSGGIFVLESNDLTIDDVGLSVNRVGSDGATLTTTTDVVQSDIRTTGGNGNVVLRTTAGSITLNNGTAPSDDTAVSANGSGNVLIQALDTDTDITANADIVSGSGNVSVLAARSVSFTGTADIRTTSANSGSGSIDVEASSGAITQASTSLFTSSGATARARLMAATNVTVGDVVLAAGMVSITATSGSILDADGLESGANDTDPDIEAASLRLDAGIAVAQTVNHLDTTVATISARAAGGGIYLSEADAITVNTVEVIVRRVSTTATTSAVTDASQSDLRTTGANGNVVLVAGGTVTLNDGTANTGAAGVAGTAVSANGSGNILIQALGAGTDITANADIVSGSGNVSVLAARSVSFTGTADIRTTSTGAGSGSIDVLAGTGSIAQSATSVFLSTGETATARLLAATDVTVGDIELTLGQVSITATAGSILDADVVTTTNDADQDITASALRLVAGLGIGESGNHLETTVGTLSARSTAGATFVTESDAVTVGTVSLTVNRVAADGTTATTGTAASQEDLSSGADLVLVTLNGGITTTVGTGEITAAQDILLSTGETVEGTVADVVLNAAMTSTGGHISVISKDGVSLNDATADITTAGGTVDVQADA